MFTSCGTTVAILKHDANLQVEAIAEPDVVSELSARLN